MALALVFANVCFADEIRLRDGKKLYGVIVAYEDNMFKVKTDFGFVLVEKDKIASIVPATGPAASTENAASDKNAAAPKNAAAAETTSGLIDAEPQPNDVAPGEGGLARSTNNSASPINNRKRAKPSLNFEEISVRPSLPTIVAKPAKITAPTISVPSAPKNPLVTPAPSVTPPKQPELPAMREEVQGNVYRNYTHGFQMYKAPSWSVIEDARMALPNAIVAMGTYDESTLMVVGLEKTKEPLDAAGVAVEKRLREVYSNYRRLSQRKIAVGGLPAVEYHYRGLADQHDWSGTLVVIARGREIFSVLGMTYADTDLIQIQENIVARAIASLNFKFAN
jgi:hypothetical protein